MRLILNIIFGGEEAGVFIIRKRKHVDHFV